MTVEVFSDISQAYRKVPKTRRRTRVCATAYCFIVMRNGERIAESVGSLAQFGPMSADTAEIWATALGVESCPHTSAVIAWSDLTGLPAIMAGSQVSYQNSIAKALARLIHARAAFASVEVRIVDRKHPIYRECHKRAGKHAEQLAAACPGL